METNDKEEKQPTKKSLLTSKKQLKSNQKMLND
jgi:hypothetical protein